MAEETYQQWYDRKAAEEAAWKKRWQEMPRIHTLKLRVECSVPPNTRAPDFDRWTSFYSAERIEKLGYPVPPGYWVSMVMKEYREFGYDPYSVRVVSLTPDISCWQKGSSLSLVVE